MSAGQTMVCQNFNCYRSRRGRVRTVPSSRANSSKQCRVDPSESPGQQSKRSRSASEEPWDSSTSGLEIRGSESQIHREAEPYSTPSHHINRPRRLTKVCQRSPDMQSRFCVIYGALVERAAREIWLVHIVLRTIFTIHFGGFISNIEIGIQYIIIHIYPTLLF